MSGRTQSDGSLPGETRPLDAAPGVRYAAAGESEMPVPAKLARAVAFGLGGVIVTALVWGFFSAVLELDVGLLVIALVGAWVIGGAVAWGAWQGAAHLPSRGVAYLAAGLGLLGWLAGTFVAYLLAMLLLPGSTVSFGERLAALPFADWLGPQIGLLDAVAIAILIMVSWRSAR